MGLGTGQWHRHSLRRMFEGGPPPTPLKGGSSVRYPQTQARCMSTRACHQHPLRQPPLKQRTNRWQAIKGGFNYPLPGVRILRASFWGIPENFRCYVRSFSPALDMLTSFLAANRTQVHTPILIISPSVVPNSSALRTLLLIT